MTGRPPGSYEGLTQAVQLRFDGLSRGYQKVARYLIQNPNEVAIQSANGIAQRCGVHASSLVRFAQAFDYTGFRELQAIFQKRLTTALKDELELHRQPGARGFLADLVARDIASLRTLLDDVDEDGLRQAVELLTGADTIYLVGQLRSEPIALFLRYVLTMLQRRVTLLDASGGLATEVSKVFRPSDVLLAISFRFYAKEVVSICESAQKLGMPVIAISDSALSPLAKSAQVFFAIPEDEYTFSRSLAAPMCLSQALMIALAARLEASDEAPRIPVVTEPRH